ncbi:hypothetical protein [Niveispirillum sp.]|uniref:phage tail assembly chaperone n=1 Tax=Niveispirillum sp. TaxID=1917217 RepID=UPI001B567B77|nr:hypothetical protein [Niveispirillum sp.]MBP7339091.1 hypothetical protein [Niveispirillum sp.]
MAKEDPEAAAFAAQAEAVTINLDPGWNWIWRAWRRLGAERQWIAGGMGPSQPADIPWTAVMAWAERYGLGEVKSELLDHVIAAMDAVYREWWAEKASRKEAG